MFGIVLVVGVSYVLGRDEITISNVLSGGNEVVTDKALSALVQSELEGKYLHLFPKASIFFYPKKQLEASVLNAFKRVKTASISFTDFQSISIDIKERSPYALWCGENETLEEVKNECYFLDERGFVYATAPHFSGNTFFRYYGILEDASLPIGAHFLVPDMFREITFFIQTLKSITPLPVSLAVVSDTNMEITLVDTSRLLVRRDTNLTRTLENIQSFFDSKEYQDRGDKELDYVDFRYGNKVYFTFE